MKKTVIHDEPLEQAFAQMREVPGQQLLRGTLEEYHRSQNYCKKTLYQIQEDPIDPWPQYF